MMTLEEAIEHCKEVAKESREAALYYARENAYETAISCKAVGYEHEQLAEWLIELKQRREAKNSKKHKTNADLIRQMTDEELADFFCQMSQCCANDAGCSMCPIYDGCAQNVMCVESWLKQEVSEDD